MRAFDGLPKRRLVTCRSRPMTDPAPISEDLVESLALARALKAMDDSRPGQRWAILWRVAGAASAALLVSNIIALTLAESLLTVSPGIVLVLLLAVNTFNAVISLRLMRGLGTARSALEAEFPIQQFASLLAAAAGASHLRDGAVSGNAGWSLFRYAFIRGRITRRARVHTVAVLGPIVEASVTQALSSSDGDRA